MVPIRFFVPGVPGFPDEAGAHAQLAAFCAVPVPPPGERVYSITFRANEEEWTATVGHLLTGRRTRRVRRKGGTIEKTFPLPSSATVIAIFDGDPAMVVIDRPPFGTSRSEWHNPFMAGVPTRVEYFTE